MNILSKILTGKLVDQGGAKNIKQTTRRILVCIFATREHGGRAVHIRFIFRQQQRCTTQFSAQMKNLKIKSNFAMNISPSTQYFP